MTLEGSIELQFVYLILALVLVGLNAFFVAAEFALVKIRSTRLEILAKKGHPIAALAQDMVSRLDPYLSATQLGITLASLGLGWIGEPTFAHLLKPLFQALHPNFSQQTLHSFAFATAFITISALHIVLGELVPKSIAIQTAEKICLIVAVPLRIFYILFFPFLWILNGSSRLILGVLRIPLASDAERIHSEEELKLIIEDSYEGGAIGMRKRDLLEKAFDFSHKTIRDIMVPEKNMISFEITDSLDWAIAKAQEYGFTRFPLKREGKYIGFVHIKDFIWEFEDAHLINLYDMQRPLITFSETTRLDTALREFQSKKLHMALVENNVGKIMGLVTMEDIIEELVGDIEDEFA